MNVFDTNLAAFILALLLVTIMCISALAVAYEVLFVLTFIAVAAWLPIVFASVMFSWGRDTLDTLIRTLLSIYVSYLSLALFLGIGWKILLIAFGMPDDLPINPTLVESNIGKYVVEITLTNQLTSAILYTGGLLFCVYNVKTIGMLVFGKSSGVSASGAMRAMRMLKP